MKYCTRCGNQIKKDSRFCPKCGNPTEIILKEKEEKRKREKEENKERLLLIIGTLFIIVASVVFAFANWNDMTSSLRILFLSIESLLFLSLSLFCKRTNEKMKYKFLWFIGISFIPVIFNIIGMDEMLGEYLSYNGNGLYVYLSISSFICFIIYYLSNKFLKSNVFLYVSYLFMYLTIVFILYMLNLDKYNLIIPMLLLINLLIIVIHFHIKNENSRLCINRFISLVVLVFTIYSCSYLNFNNYLLLNISILLSNVFAILLLIFKSNKNIFIYIYPFFLYIVCNYAFNNIFINYVNVLALSSILVTLLINFILHFKDNKAIHIISYIFMLFNLLYFVTYGISYLTLAICSIIIFISFVFIIKLNDTDFTKVISTLLLPISLFVIVNSIINNYLNINISIIYLISSIICFTVYQIYCIKDKKGLIKNTFEVYSYLYIGLSSLLILADDNMVISFVLNEILWLYYFIFNSYIKKHKAVTITLLILLIINFILCSFKFSIEFYYSLLFITFIMIILDYISLRNNKKSIYVYFAFSFSLITILNNYLYMSLFAFALTIISYICIYYSLIKKHNCKFIFKFLYTLMGFKLISFIFNYFIESTLLISILTLVAYIIILISMYLLEVDKDNRIFGYSFVLLFPYLDVIDNINVLYDYKVSLVVLIVSMLILIYFEKVFNLKEKDKTIFELVFLIILHLITFTSIVSFNFILGTFYLFYGFYKKRDSFVIFATILLLLTLVVNLFRLFDNSAITYVLLVLGASMLLYVFYIEGKKKK